MPALKFRIDNFDYQSRPMNAKTQLLLVRKTLPIIAAGFGEFVPLFLEMRQAGLKGVLDANLHRASEMLTPIATEFAKLTEEDSWTILSSCLSLCERRADGADMWVQVWVPGAQAANGDDLNFDAMLMLRIALEVFRGNLTNFCPASLFELFEGGKASTTTPSA